ncbi:MAG: hypothetical protein HOD63_17515 [Bacteroidetes bacterium]|jgi:hypothetical protein|nr:hypothetical protein [Bacteroidota bacterium]MBT5529887.1 hypothetical protein [Cytophagia bacterium]MBT4340393.1 hypothetical protein [Bacteroidota bacterium]MBT4730250.1 hypothetical protein [Bacteroidota bacterium]MBT4969653.1 hypothetical protein [Bacteroidota bacterium]
MEISDQKVCKFCNKSFKGRADKLFCSTDCRTAFHNSVKNKDEDFIRSLNKILRKNRSILKYVSPKGKTTVAKSFLSDLDFNFDFYTDHRTTKNGNTYVYCYDYGYLVLEDEKILIINRQDHLKNLF